jgi:HAD superfamily hydrolase (TIGR01509 family)
VSSRPLAVLFDLGKVLCAFDWQRSMTRLQQHIPNLDTDAFVEWLLSPEGPHDAYCRGEIDERYLLDNIHRRIDPREQIEDSWLVELWNDMFTPLPDSLDIVDDLRGRVRLGLISNTNALHFQHLDRMLDLSSRFDDLTLSFQEGVLKPQRTIFEAALGRARIRPEEGLFIDDLPEHVAAASRLGIRSLLFTDAQTLRGELSRMGAFSD